MFVETNQNFDNKTLFYVIKKKICKHSSVAMLLPVIIEGLALHNDNNFLTIKKNLGNALIN